jgi:hypothetical protein
LQLERVSPEERFGVIGRYPGAEFEGTVLVEWLSADGETVAKEQVEVHEPNFEVSLKPEALPEGCILAGARAYMWSEVSGEDAIGWIDLADEDEIAAAAAEDTPPTVRRRRRAQSRGDQKDIQP